MDRIVGKFIPECHSSKNELIPFPNGSGVAGYSKSIGQGQHWTLLWAGGHSAAVLARPTLLRSPYHLSPCKLLPGK